MKIENDRRYGFLDYGCDDVIIRQHKGQVTSSGGIGILSIENMYIPVLPGNVMNGYTYNYPIQIQFVKGLDNKSLFAGKPEVYERILDACVELEKYGVRAITGACGFFGHYQSRLAAELDIPVALSSLVELPWIASILKPDERIGVLTANEEACTQKLLKSCNVSDEIINRLVIKGLGHEPQFSAIIEDRGVFDNAVVKMEMIGKAEEMIAEHPEIGAFLLECTEMPPYAYLIQQVTQRPVYDFITMLDWLQSGLCRRPYSGFM